MSLLDYVTYVESLPQMNLLFRYSHMTDLPGVFISLLMSFGTFSLLNKQTYCRPDECEEVTSHKLTCGEDNVFLPTKLFFSPVLNGVVAKKSDSPSKVAIHDVPEEFSIHDEDNLEAVHDGEGEILELLIEEMYTKCFPRVEDGGQGIVLPPRNKSKCKSRKRYNSYMYATYIDPASNSRFDCWITKEPAITVCVCLCVCVCVFFFEIKHNIQVPMPWITHIALHRSFLFLRFHLQYCTDHGCILVDTSDHLFLLFHYLVHKAVTHVAKTLMQSNVNVEEHDNLSTWCSCDFSREDTFQEVKHKLSTFVSNIAEYLSFALEIPFISELIAVAEVKETTYVCVTSGTPR